MPEQIVVLGDERGDDAGDQRPARRGEPRAGERAGGHHEGDHGAEPETPAKGLPQCILERGQNSQPGKRHDVARRHLGQQHCHGTSGEGEQHHQRGRDQGGPVAAGRRPGVGAGQHRNTDAGYVGRMPPKSALTTEVSPTTTVTGVAGTL